MLDSTSDRSTKSAFRAGHQQAMVQQLWTSRQLWVFIVIDQQLRKPWQQPEWRESKRQLLSWGVRWYIVKGVLLGAHFQVVFHKSCGSSQDENGSLKKWKYKLLSLIQPKQEFIVYILYFGIWWEFLYKIKRWTLQGREEKYIFFTNPKMVHSNGQNQINLLSLIWNY